MDVYNQPVPNKSIRGRVVLFVVLAVLVVLGYWFSTVSFIEFSAPTGSSYELTNQQNNKQAKGSSNGTTKLRVQRGSYELILKSKDGQKSYFILTRANGFWRKTTVEIKGDLQAQKQRTFIGDSPETCMNLINSTLVSYTCSDSFSSIKTHVPATVNSPTYVTKNTGSNLAGSTEGIISSNGRYVALLAWPGIGDHPAQHYLYQINDRLEASGETLLEALDGSKTYSVKATSSGFAAYDSTFENVHYYNLDGALIKSQKLDSPKEAGLSASFMGVDDDLVVRLFSSDTSDKSEVVVSRGSKSTHYVLDQKYTSARSCGNNKLCAVGNSKLDVYDIGGEKAKKLYFINNVSGVENSPSGLLVVRRDSILNFDVDDEHGFLEYSFESFEYNSLFAANGGYILNLTSPTGKKVALMINQKAVNTDSIDRKISSFVKLTGINDVSINRQFIFISPNLGDMVYDNVSGSFDYDPAARAAATKLINDAINKLKIDQSVYHITNTAE